MNKSPNDNGNCKYILDVLFCQSCKIAKTLCRMEISCTHYIAIVKEAVKLSLNVREKPESKSLYRAVQSGEHT